MSVNKVILVGRVGKAPEIRTTQDGREIANFSLATSEKWKDKATGDKKEKTEWHKIVIFNPSLVKVVKDYVKKGSQLYLEGSIGTRKWQNKEGQDCYSTEIILQQFNGTLQLLGGNKEGKEENHDYSSYDRTTQQAPVVQETEEGGVLDDEVPF